MTKDRDIIFIKQGVPSPKRGRLALGSYKSNRYAEQLEQQRAGQDSMATQIRRLGQDGALTPNEVAKLIGCDRAYVYTLKRIYNLNFKHGNENRIRQGLFPPSGRNTAIAEQLAAGDTL